ncbi:hypothetical protein VX159_02750 [Dechloromonas sp. ZY10]|uniref:hypothetical protein n=1 Tax=Dechloromonas aquae TaxID=2664436 RepID=UPI003526DD24
MKKEKTALQLSAAARPRAGFYRKSRLKNSQATAAARLAVAFAAVAAGLVNAP